MRGRTRNWLALFSAVGLLAIIGLVLFRLTEPAPAPAMPNPNGYNDFVTASRMVGHSDYENLDLEQLRALVVTEAEALQIARAGFQRECRVVLDYSPTSTVHLDEMSAMKALALAFAAEGKLAEMENRSGDAVRSYVDIIHLGQELARGGVIIHQLVGSAMEAIGRRHLNALVTRLDANSCREVSTNLEALDARKQSWADVSRQEREWSRRAFPGVRHRLAALLMRNSMNKGLQNAEHKFNEQQTSARQLLIDLAARAYELEKGHRPASLADLVPDYLKAVPQDPVTGTNMAYTP